MIKSIKYPFKRFFLVTWVLPKQRKMKELENRRIEDREHQGGEGAKEEKTGKKLGGGRQQ